MKEILLKQSGLKVPVLAAGCMRIGDMEENAIASYIDYCLEQGMYFFDHADIYGGGSCEEKFGTVFSSMDVKREDILIQSKCGIVPGVMYDFSKEHIIRSVEGSLKRLKTDYLDCLLLHRPDALMEPEEVAEAFEQLWREGKVRHFGVSNQKPMQMELLKKDVRQKLEVNQLQLSIPFSNMIANGLEVNMLTSGAVDRDGSVLDYCRLHDITIQVWSPFQYGFFEGVFLRDKDKFPELHKVLEELALKYQVTISGIATAWILRHPAKMQMVTGSTGQAHLKEIVEGTEIELTRQEWYRLYLAAGHMLP